MRLTTLEERDAQFEAMRIAMNDIYKLDDVYRLNKPEITAHLTKVLGEKFTAEGAPEKLEWLRMMDGSGIIPSQTKEGIATEDYIRSATAVRNQRIAKLENQYEDQLELKRLEVGKKFINDAFKLEPDDTQSWGELDAYLTSNKKYFPNAEYKGYKNMTRLMQDRSNFSTTGTDKEVFAELYTKARNRTLTVAELNSQTQFLEKDRYTKIFNELHTALDKKRKGSTRMGKVEKAVNGMTKYVIGIAGGAIDDMGQLMNKWTGNPEMRKFVWKAYVQWTNISHDHNDFKDKEGRLDSKASDQKVEELWSSLQSEFPDQIKRIRAGKNPAGDNAKTPIPVDADSNASQAVMDKISAKAELNKKK